jgi:hypothetical protein
VNNSLFTLLLKQMVSMESNAQPEAAPAASPLLSLQFVDLYYFFVFLHRIVMKSPDGGIYSWF